jgi:ParB family transcriptional regulator, chromosome partitioning protein
MTNLDKIIAAARSKQEQQATSFKPQDSTMSLGQIQARQQDTRPLNVKHVESLAESIAVLGLIEPLVLDTQGQLLAGGHRLAAINLLKQSQPDRYAHQFPGDRIPIRVLPFSAAAEPELALQIEVAENEQRRDYTASEVRDLAHRLRSAGYVDVKGRPKKGQKALMPALAVVVGKHLRTVQRYLSDEANPATLMLEPPENSPSQKSATRVALLKQSLAKLNQWQQEKPKTAQEKALAKKLPELLELIELAISEQ